MKTEKLILKKWFARNGLSEGTRKLYENHMDIYKNFVEKSLEELIDEAEKEQDKGIKPMKRLVNDQIMLFKDHLDKEGYAPGTVNNIIAAVKSFYRAFDIETINIRLHAGDTSLDKNQGKLLTKEEIMKMLNVSNARDRAIIYLMALTGMASNEVRNLSIHKFLEAAGNSINKDIETLEDLFENEDELIKDLIIFEIVRKKVNYRHHVLMPPEVTRSIIAYLKERHFNRNDKRHIQDLNGPIFVTNQGTPMSKTGVGSEIKRIGFLAGFKKEKGAYCYWRPHSFRKYFIITIIKETRIMF